MARDPEAFAHQEWLGFVQPVGLVVSIPALLQAQAHVNKNIAPDHQRFLECLDGNDEPHIADFAAFTHDVLGWERDDLVGANDRAVPNTLEVPLPEYNETLRPTYAVPEFDRDKQSERWIMLIQQFDRSVDFDDVAVEDERRWQATPHSRLERLLRETQVPIGLLSNGVALRLVYAPRGETSGHVTFRVADMAQVAGRPIFAALHMLLNAERLFSLPEKQRLPAILADSRKYQNVVSTKLAEQVLAALYELLRGFQAADDARKGELLRDVLRDNPDHVYAGLLTTLMRLVFILYAEDRGLLSNHAVYVNHYSVTGLFDRLRADAGRFPDTMDQRFGAWAQLLVLFRIIHDGARCGDFQIPGRRGYLFDADRYPFLEGRPHDSLRSAYDKLDVPRVSDGVIFRALSNLLILDGERLSYRTLDVEQIGSVYEAIMGFRLEITTGPSIAIKPVKAHGAPAAIDLEALRAEKPANRAKWVKEHTDQKLTPTMTKPLKEAESIDDLLAALEKKIARKVTPNVVPKGNMVLQPSDERRRSGSHYTPRSLTEPIVRKTFEPILKRLGERPTPEQILDLKICDPAMGSGAFLVEACRQLGDALVKAWYDHDCLPQIPPDEDELLHARRVIAQRCLYGVDKNPMAVDLAKLSLWLATLAKDHPFTFLDHALRAGDSLVGLSRQQIADFHWKRTKEKRLGQEHIEERIQRATTARKEILDAGDAILPEEKAQKLAVADEALDAVRFFGDLCVAAFFAGVKDKQRKKKRDEYLDCLTVYLSSGDLTQRPTAQVDALRTGSFAIVPFHWEIEYPEVFARANGGFDAFVGNPPFAGHVTLSTSMHPLYTEYLRSAFQEIEGKCDLIAFFFQQSFRLLRNAGCFGLVATMTVRQGDTRSSGLRVICNSGGQIFDALSRMTWPGEASVSVCTVHVFKGAWTGPRLLDGRVVQIITAYLFHAGGHENPVRLRASSAQSFQGTVIRGTGFLFDDSKSDGTPVSEAMRLLAESTRNAQIIRPFLGGDDLVSSPTCSTSRYVIDFDDMSEEEARGWPALFAIAEKKVRPARMGSSAKTSVGKVIEDWWTFSHRATAMYASISRFDRVLACPQTSSYMVFAFVPTDIVLAQTLVVTTLASMDAFAVLQSRTHEVWAVFNCSTLEERFRYMPTDAFETFPFPWDKSDQLRLHEAGQAYYETRAELMVRNGEGLTKTYNRFHDPSETSPDIARLRELHAAMDRAVLDAYGWTDIPTDCGFALDYLDIEDEDDLPPDARDRIESGDLFFPDAGSAIRFNAAVATGRRRLPWRYRWPDAVRDEVLARLLDLNAKRAEEERLAGKTAATAEKKSAKKTKRGQKKKMSDGPMLIDVGEEAQDD